MAYKEILKQYEKPSNFLNRDLSWIEFNRRVFEEALNKELPLLERIKFISIFSSNLDEFYMIRVAALQAQVKAKVNDASIDGLSAEEQLRRIDKTIKPMLERLSDLWKDEILPSLEENGIKICRYEQLEDDDKTALDEFFRNSVFPVLTPLAFDPGRPFPYISNLSLSLAVLIRSPKGEHHFARVKVPSVLPRLLQVNMISGKKDNGTSYMFWLGDLIKANLSSLFPGMEIVEAHRFRITRDTDIEIQEDEADDLLTVIEANIRQRKFGSVVRLEVERAMPDFMLDTLVDNLEITKEEVQIIDGPLGLSDVMQLYPLPYPNLKEKSFSPVVPKIFEEDHDIFSVLKHREVLLHHPYESFSPVIDFIKQASNDPDVLAIKQTLYRVGPNSPIVKYLIEAAERGKQVAVLVELKARFDEENNIYWARELEKAGAHVVYGLVGLKTHAKMTLVVRKEWDGLRRYVHLGTGNYNTSTAKIYTDLGFFTTNNEICSDISEIFNYLTGYSKQKDFRKLLVSPIDLRSKMIGMILREAENARAGKQGRLIMKMNSLVDPYIIAALYEASSAGVEIDLIIRGICCLTPGVEGLSEKIRVRSIVGRFLEHSRIYYFYNNGQENLYLSSADMMQRNLDRRVEIAFPIEDKQLKDSIISKQLKIMLKDNQKARLLSSVGVYNFCPPDEETKSVSAQEWFMHHALRMAQKFNKKAR